MPVNVDQYRELLRETAAAGARLVAVTKQRPLADLQTLYDLGQRDFGENRADELADKAAQLPDDVRWHFIGHLQRNKVKQMIGSTHLLHSGDSLRLLRELDKRAAEQDRSLDVLLQYHIAQEQSKYGLTRDSARELLDEVGREPLSHLRIVGVMGMATYTGAAAQVQREFNELFSRFRELRAEYFPEDPAFREVSMGMSGDYQLALAAGSTLVRVGSRLFS